MSEFWSYQLAVNEDSLDDNQWTLPSDTGVDPWCRADAIQECRDNEEREEDDDLSIYVRKISLVPWPASVGFPIAAQSVIDDVDSCSDDFPEGVMTIEDTPIIEPTDEDVEDLQARLDKVWRDWLSQRNVKTTIIKFLSEPELVED